QKTDHRLVAQVVHGHLLDRERRIAGGKRLADELGPGSRGAWHRTGPQLEILGEDPLERRFVTAANARGQRELELAKDLDPAGDGRNARLRLRLVGPVA